MPSVPAMRQLRAFQQCPEGPIRDLPYQAPASCLELGGAQEAGTFHSCFLMLSGIGSLQEMVQDCERVNGYALSGHRSSDR